MPFIVGQNTILLAVLVLLCWNVAVLSARADFLANLNFGGGGGGKGGGKGGDGGGGGGNQLLEREVYQKQVNMLKTLKPLGDPAEKIMFWRPQKVGSSTILSILLSYSFRNNKFPRVKSVKNFICAELAACALNDYKIGEGSSNYSSAIISKLESFGKTNKKQAPARLQIARAKISAKLPNSLSLSHEICNIRHDIVSQHLSCVFKGEQHVASDEVKEIFVVRDPLSRMLSIYYFWGELFRIKSTNNPGGVGAKIIGSTKLKVEKVEGTLFTYHGNESSSPPKAIAVAFAERFPLLKGNPGPSYTWSCFADNVADSLSILKTNRIFTVVTERLDESLVAAKFHLGWKLADMIPTMPRKSLSTHPKHDEWPQEAVKILQEKLKKTGEYAVYDQAVSTLNRRILALKNSGVDFDGQLLLFRQLRDRVRDICLTDEYLKLYKSHLLALGLTKHHNNNKLRDSDMFYVEEGHLFDWNMELLFDYDVCGNCEAHGIMAAIENKLGTTPNDATLLKDLDESYTKSKTEFERCPVNGKPGYHRSGSGGKKKTD